MAVAAANRLILLTSILFLFVYLATRNPRRPLRIIVNRHSTTIADATQPTLISTNPPPIKELVNWDGVTAKTR